LLLDCKRIRRHPWKKTSVAVSGASKAEKVQRDNQDDGGPSMRMRGQARFL
jgi:hypothetical protein